LLVSCKWAQLLTLFDVMNYDLWVEWKGLSFTDWTLWFERGIDRLIDETAAENTSALNLFTDRQVGNQCMTHKTGKCRVQWSIRTLPSLPLQTDDCRADSEGMIWLLKSTAHTDSVPGCMLGGRVCVHPQHRLRPPNDRRFRRRGEWKHCRRLTRRLSPKHHSKCIPTQKKGNPPHHSYPFSGQRSKVHLHSWGR